MFGRIVNSDEIIFEYEHARIHARLGVGAAGRDDMSSGFKLVTLEDQDEKRAERPLAFPHRGPSAPTLILAGRYLHRIPVRGLKHTAATLFETALARLHSCFNINGKADGKPERKEIEGK